jgi:hypothetical protein
MVSLEGGFYMAKDPGKPKRQSHSGAFYEITDDLRERLEEVLKTKTQGEVARELSHHLSRQRGRKVVVDQSSISNIASRRYPSSKMAGPLAAMYGWPVPPVARQMPGEGTEFAAEVLSKLDRLHQIRPEKAASIKMFIDGELQKAEGEIKTEQAVAALRGEPSVRGTDPSRTPGEEDE